MDISKKGLHRRGTENTENVVFSFAGRRRQRKSIIPIGQTTLLFPQGQAIFAHRRLPMGKKDKTLCALCVSVVNKYYLKYATVTMN